MTAVGEIVVDERFRGPPDSGNGGYVSGRLAAFVRAPVVTVRLTAPPPLSRPLAVFAAGDGVELRDGERLVATAGPGSLGVGDPPVVGPEQAREAAKRTRINAEEHPFPTCFGCGPLREPGDALRHMCGPVGDDDGVVAAPATTDPRLPHDDTGALLPEIVWAALDCPSATPVVPWGELNRPHVLGTFTARLDRPVLAGEPYVCVAWPLEVDGRKKHSASAIIDPEGHICAVARALWIELRPPL